MALSLASDTALGSTSNTQDQGLFWHTVWNLRIPNKIKTFIWKACQDILPTKVNLRCRQVLEDATCEACGLDSKTTGHLLWDCQRARETWELSGIPFDITRIRYRDSKDLLWYLIFTKHVDRDLLVLIVIMAWCMWFNRNKTRLGSPRQPSREILHKARLILEEF